MVTVESILDWIPALGVIVALVYYTITVRNQNKTRQAQLFMNIHRQMTSKEAQMDYLDIETIEMKSYEDYKQLKEDRRMFSVLAWHFSYYEGIGVLIKEGFLDIGLVAKMSSGNIIWFWERFRDGVYDLRDKMNWVRWGIEVEYLYERILDYAKKHPELEIAISGQIERNP